MRKFAKEKASPATSEGEASRPSSKKEGSGNWFRLHWRLLSLFAILIMAFLLRFVFAYGISAGDNYALSGGSSASSHLRIVTEILAGTYDPANEASLNYPYGTGSISGPLFDYVMAFFAWLVTLFGVSDATAAAGTLAWSAPILGALTCIPVYLIGRKIFKDETIGVASALFYAVFAVTIMTTPFSNGTEYPFLCFIVAWLVYFAVSAFAAADETDAVGFKSVFKGKVFKFTFLTGLFLGFVFLTWTGFWAIVLSIAIMFLVALIVERIGGKDIGVTIGITVVSLLIATILGALYYIPEELWSDVYEGGCLLAVLTIIYGLLFLAMQKKPWVLSIPVMAVVIIVVAALLAVFVPSVSSALLSGSNAYSGSLSESLADQFSRTSISTMAAYYGWLTLWFPLFAGVWMAYKFRSNSKSRLYLFTMLWMFACFFVGWFSTEYAIVAGAGFAVGSAYVVVSVFRAVDLKAYFRSLRGNGFKAGAKKALNFFPLVTVLVAVFLVAVPTAVYAVDASTPTNDEHADYFGGLGYTISTTDSTLMNSAWDHYRNVEKDGALLSWYGYSDAASSVGKFTTVTSPNAGGASAMASAYLSEGSSGALAAMIVRLAEDDASKFASIFQNYGVADVVSYIDDESAARAYIAAHPDDFVKYNTEISDESLPYIVGASYLAAELNGTQLSDLYDAVCTQSGNKIGYIEVDSSMIPMYAGDGSYASTLAYFADYALDDNGAPANLYSVTSTTRTYYQYGYYAQMYYTYTDAMYETFLWNALMGVTPSQFGLSTSLDLLSSLANSDGTVKAQPGTGFDNFKISYWHVMYRATEDSDWTDMDAYEAIEKQNTDGGYINYLASVIMYQYDNTQTVQSGIVETAAHQPVPGVKVAVFEKVTYDSKSSASYIQRSTAYTDDTGRFSVSVPSGDYLVKYFVGSESLRDGTCVNTVTSAGDYVLDFVDQTGYLVDGDNNHYLDSGAHLSFVGSDGAVKASADVAADGSFSVTGLVPDVYTINVYGPDSSSLNTVSSVSIISAISNFYVSAAACEVNVTVNDLYGAASTNSVVVTFSGANGYTATTGTGKVYLPEGTFTVYVSDASGKYLSVESKSITTKDDSATSVTVVVYDANVTSAAVGSVLMGIGYSAVVGADALVPAALDGKLAVYTGSEAVKVAGTLKNSSGAAVTGTVAFTDGTIAYVFAADSDGKFSGNVPAGTYTVYATNGSNLSYFGQFDGNSNEDLSYSMQTAYAATSTVRYSTNMSTSNTGIAFVPVTYTVTIGETTYSIPAITGSSGTHRIYVPSGATVGYSVATADLNKYAFLNVKDEDGTAFTSSNSTVTSSTTLDTLTFSSTYSADTNSVKGITPSDLTFTNGSSNFTGKLVFDAYSGSSNDRIAEITNGVIGEDKLFVYSGGEAGEVVTEFTPGRYTVTIKDSDNQYIDDQTVNIYPGTKVVDLTVVDCFKVTVEKNEVSDTVEVVAVEKDGETGEHYTDDDVYYFQTGYEYYFKVTDTDDHVAYSPVFGGDYTFRDYETAEAVTLKGYVGASLDGDLFVENGTFRVQTEVSKGEYSTSLPTGTVITGIYLDASSTSDGYTYSTDVAENLITNFTVSEDTTLNLATLTSQAQESDAVTISSATMVDGIGTVTLTVKNSNEYPVTYFVTGNSTFTLDKVYAVNIVAASGGIDSTATVTVSGYYNVNTIGAGNSDAVLTVSATDGTSIGTAVIPKSAYDTSITGDLTVDYSDTDGVSDAVDGYSYKYALRFTNDNSATKTVTVRSTVPEGWLVRLADSTGLLISDNDSSVELNGLGETMVYVMLINEDGDSSVAVPGITVTVSGDLDSTKDLTRATAEISSTDGSVSGGNADNSENTVPAGFWILTVFAILILLLTIWGGMKRGVFSRKN